MRTGKHSEQDMITRRTFRWPGVVLLTLVGGLSSAVVAQGRPLPVKVFILAGQSNMQGHGALRMIDSLGQDPQYGHLLKKIKTDDGSWTVRDDVWIYYPRDSGTLKKGELTVGYGANDEKIGPELMFGNIVGDHFDNQVLLIKIAWGGKSLAGDFRPPRSSGETGPYYKQMLDIVKTALNGLDQHFPDYQGQGYELAGFVWFQGWNDMVDADHVAEYEDNLVNLIQDVRRDLEVPNLPIVIGELGVGGPDEAEKNGRMSQIRKAQAAPTHREEFIGTVAFVATSKYWDDTAHEIQKKYWIRREWTDALARQRFEKMGSQPPYHYLGSAKIYSLMGYGFAKAMLDLQPPADQKERRSESDD